MRKPGRRRVCQSHSPFLAREPLHVHILPSSRFPSPAPTLRHHLNPRRTPSLPALPPPSNLAFLLPALPLPPFGFAIALLWVYSIRTHSTAALVEMGVPPAQLYTTALGQGGKIAVDFIPEGDVGSELRFSTVPLRFIPTSRLGVDGWRTLHLAINCHFDPLPHKYCQHSGPCEHREKPSDVDQTTKPSVRSWQGKRDDYALSEPLPSAAELRRSSQVHMIGGGRRSDLRGGNGMSGTALAKATGRGGGPRQAYGEGTRSAFYSSTRTPNPHVGGDGQLSPYAWKTSLLWAEASRHGGDDGSDVLLWEPACCLDQVQASRRNVDAVRYAESVLAALEAVEMLWVHGTRPPRVPQSHRAAWLASKLALCLCSCRAPLPAQ